MKSRFYNVLLATLLLSVIAAAYAPALNAGFIWDDDSLLTANPQMQGASGLSQIWRGINTKDYTPFTSSVFWIATNLWGNNAPAYHWLNLFLHAISALLIWQIFLRLRIPGAWLGALLFAIHPVNVASVAWIAELKNTLSGALFFGAILFWLPARDETVQPSAPAQPGRQWARYLASLFLFGAASLSKGSVVTLPLVLLLCSIWLDGRITAQTLRRVIPFFAVAGVMALLTILFQSRAPHYWLIPNSPAYQLSRAGAVFWFYLASIVWPIGLSPMRQPWLPALTSAIAWLPSIAACGLVALLFWKRRTRAARPAAFAFAVFIVMLLPVLGFIWMALLQQTPAADWWAYLAAPAIFALCAAGADSAMKKWRIAMPLVALVVLLLGIQTYRRAGIYYSLQTYCEAVLPEDPTAWTLQNNLGILLKREGRFAEAEACFHHALRDNPNYPEAHINLANTLVNAGDPRQAESEYRKAIAMQPGDPRSLQPLADLLAAESRFADALPIQAAAVAANPGDPSALLNLGGLYGRTGKLPEAESCFRHALAIVPQSIVIRMDLCQALAMDGKQSEAAAVCDEADALAHQSGNASGIRQIEDYRKTKLRNLSAQSGPRG